MDETDRLAGLRKIVYHYISSPMVFLLAEDCCPDFNVNQDLVFLLLLMLY